MSYNHTLIFNWLVAISSQSSSTAVSRDSLNYSSAGLGSSLYSPGADPTENTVFIAIAQQYLDCCLLIRCRWNLFTESLRSNERLLWLSGVFSQYDKCWTYGSREHGKESPGFIKLSQALSSMEWENYLCLLPWLVRRYFESRLGLRRFPVIYCLLT
jgi:hypothetical protein